MGLGLQGLPADEALALLPPGEGWLEAMAKARATGASGTVLRLPVPGAVRGVAPLPQGASLSSSDASSATPLGPTAALVGLVRVEQAALTVVAWISPPSGTDDSWMWVDADQTLPVPPGMAESDRLLRQVTLACLETWEGADLMTGAGEQRDVIEHEVRQWLSPPRGPHQRLPQAYAARAAVLERAVRILAAATLTGHSSVGATSSDIDTRRRIVAELGRAARDTVEACCSMLPGD